MKSRLLVLLALARPDSFCWPQENGANHNFRGKFLYEEYAGCASCHGADGKGNVEGVTLDSPPPDLSECSFNSREPRRD